MLVNRAIDFNKPNATNALTAPIPNASAEILSSRVVVVKSPSSFDTFLPRSNCFISFSSTRSNISYYDVRLHCCNDVSELHHCPFVLKSAAHAAFLSCVCTVAAVYHGANVLLRDLVD